MNCNEVSEALEPYIAGDLDDRESTRVAEHLASCRACAEECEDMRLLIGELKRLRFVFRPTKLHTDALLEALPSMLASRPRGRS